MTAKMGKITVSLSEHLISSVDHIARDRGISRSKLISILLEELVCKQQEELLSEGYREMANENMAFAEDSIGNIPQGKDTSF
jgi:metal-responsive CopG/Arc/MetJ family transcriptional regulator